MTLEEHEPGNRTAMEAKLSRPMRESLVRVVMHYTTVFDDHVAKDMLASAFHKSETEIAMVIDTMRTAGLAVIDVCPRQIAETRIDTMRAIARKEKCRIDVRLEVVGR